MPTILRAPTGNYLWAEAQLTGSGWRASPEEVALHPTDSCKDWPGQLFVVLGFHPCSRPKGWILYSSRAALGLAWQMVGGWPPYNFRLEGSIAFPGGLSIL